MQITCILQFTCSIFAPCLYNTKDNLIINKMTTKEFNNKLEKLRSDLTGHVQTVADEMNIPMITVWRALQGKKVKTEGVIEKCIEVRDRIQLAEQIKLQQLANKI